ncbi:MAG: hypothetical protein NXI07_12275, partial [bacterium]|nr:hypothetical protein [bacterium]
SVVDESVADAPLSALSMLKTSPVRKPPTELSDVFVTEKVSTPLLPLVWLYSIEPVSSAPVQELFVVLLESDMKFTVSADATPAETASAAARTESEPVFMILTSLNPISRAVHFFS